MVRHPWRVSEQSLPISLNYDCSLMHRPYSYIVRESLDSLVKYYMGTWVRGYELYDPIPVPSLPDGYDIFPFTYPWVIFYPIPLP